MPQRRTLIIAGWALAALAVWAALYNGTVFFLIFYLQNEKGYSLSSDLMTSVHVIGIAGLVVAPIVFAWLGAHGKLPGTRQVRRKGFEVVTPTTHNAA